ncbi:trigger factor [Salisediminibacterium halotolerans]|uniref:trigger factor n=1 Tax=Salisediminibacterium halotolerans TaxID=517425 RepID=UPI000EB1612E|nr:trigger factor [Salisediminibacterium halotolerans]RLJ81106.1 trigger factor [Actinophytocola xinjiangensis]RPE84085.1 trigger factor [Salisediminibacterium halotolerans]TWG38533.1 trigger factor [Salisediminibacterium halotolerans]GEL07191.1 trigger factor [Salisediminibacterium halotolerans]
MTANWEKQEGNTGVLTVEVDSERFNKALDEAFKKVVKDVNIPGFRKGRVPRQIFEQRFGVESLYQDAVDIVLPQAYSEAVEEAGIEPVDQPQIDIEEIEKGSPLKFKATVTVKPEVELGQYKGLAVDAQDTEVTAEEIDQEIEQLREQHADLAAVEDGEVQSGDTVVMDFEGFVDGEAFEGGQAENYTLEIGSGQFIPGFEEELIGAKSGEETEVNVEFPEEYHAEELAGKPAVFKVKVHDIKRKDLPELDDEFAKDVNEEHESFEDLKQEVTDRLKKQKEDDAEMAKKDALVEQATENTTIDLPDAMIDTEADRMLEEFGQRLQQQGMSLDMYYQFAQTDAEGMKEQFKEDAEKRVRMNLTLEAISEAENIEVSEEDIDAEIEKMAEMYQRPAEEIKQILSMQGGTDTLKNDLKVRKAIELLVENSEEKAAE